MVYGPLEAKDVLIASKRQVAMVIDLSKCLGCQTCTVACKTLWTNDEGKQHMRWMSVSTHPGQGYPRNWEKKGGGFDKGEPKAGKLLNMSECGDTLKYNHKEALFGGNGQSVNLHPVNSEGHEPTWSYNWDEDQGAGIFPNSYFWYLPKLCNHCSNPPCVQACPRNSLYKREEDGIVVLDQERCHGYQHCVEACPYGAIYFNPITETSEKCIFCYPRLEQGVTTACSRQCPGRTRHVGYLDDPTSNVHKLVVDWKVALPLHPEYGTKPNVYYIPPLSAQAFKPDGSLSDDRRVPMEILDNLFGPAVRPAMATLETELEKKRNHQPSELMDLLISREWIKMFSVFDKSPADIEGKR